MSKGGAVVLEKALALPPDERAELVDRLLSSLNTERERRIEELWAQEAEDRLEAFDRGEIKAVAMQNVLEPKKARSRDLDRRYDDLENGRVKPVPGKEVIARL